MEYDRRQYFREHDDESVKGFTVIETDQTEGYRVAEKWQRDNESNKWISYWVSEEKLADRVADSLCEPAATLTDEQFERVCENVDARVLADPSPAAAASESSGERA